MIGRCHRVRSASAVTAAARFVCLLAHGFPVSLLVDLCVAGLVTATPEHMVAGGRKVEVVRLKITDAGRSAQAG